MESVINEVPAVLVAAIVAYIVGRMQEAYRRKAMKADRLDERLFEDYETVLRPYLLLLRGENVQKTTNMIKRNQGWAKEAIQLSQDPAYHDALSRIALTAPNYVIHSLSEFHEHFRNNHYGEAPPPPDQREILVQLRTLIGNVRKGFGRRNKRGVVNSMLRLFIHDYDNIV